MHTINVVTSPKCKCGQVEDSEHFIYRCDRYSRIWSVLRVEINKICDKLSLAAGIKMDKPRWAESQANKGE